MANLSFIKKSLPWLGTIASIAVPGAAPVIGIASKILGAKLGTAVPPTADGLAGVLEDALGTPAQHAQLLEAEQAFQQAMQQMNYQHETDLETIAASDRQSARQMQVATRSSLPSILAVSVTLGFFGILTLDALHAAPASSEKVMDIMTGSLGTAWIMIITYFFGSSAGSDRKTEILANGNGH